MAATYRRPEALTTLLGSLARQTLPHDHFEVAVVVDGLDEHQAEYRRVLQQGRSALGAALHFEFQPNAGPAAARRRAIAATRAPMVCIVDDDMDLAAEFLAEHLATLEAGEDVVCIGGVVPEEGWERGPLYEAVRTKAMLELHQGIASGARAAQASAFVTQNVSLGRRLFDAVGGFDESLRLGEDTELGLRLEGAGARFRYAARASAVHRSRVGSYDVWLRRQLEYGRYAPYVFEKLGQDARAHPLRDLVNGSRLNALAVHSLCWSDGLTRVGISALHRLGVELQKAGMTDLAIATHKAIRALAYHLGVKQALGSWGGMMAAKRAFASRAGRPLDPT